MLGVARHRHESKPLTAATLVVYVWVRCLVGRFGCLRGASLGRFVCDLHVGGLLRDPDGVVPLGLAWTNGADRWGVLAVSGQAVGLNPSRGLHGGSRMSFVLPGGVRPGYVFRVDIPHGEVGRGPDGSNRVWVADHPVSGFLVGGPLCAVLDLHVSHPLRAASVQRACRNGSAGTVWAPRQGRAPGFGLETVAAASACVRARAVFDCSVWAAVVWRHTAWDAATCGVPAGPVWWRGTSRGSAELRPGLGSASPQPTAVVRPVWKVPEPLAEGSVLIMVGIACRLFVSGRRYRVTVEIAACGAVLAGARVTYDPWEGTVVLTGHVERNGPSRLAGAVNSAGEPGDLTRNRVSLGDRLGRWIVLSRGRWLACRSCRSSKASRFSRYGSPGYERPFWRPACSSPCRLSRRLIVWVVLVRIALSSSSRRSSSRRR